MYPIENTASSASGGLPKFLEQIPFWGFDTAVRRLCGLCGSRDGPVYTAIRTSEGKLCGTGNTQKVLKYNSLKRKNST